MLPLKSLAHALTVILATSNVVAALPAETTPAESTALLEKRSCPAKKRMYSWNAGCSSEWSGRCYDTCISQGRNKGCCEFVSSLISDKCGWVSKNCYCDCYIPA